MDIDFWRDRWNEDKTAFHQQQVNPYLAYYYGEKGPSREKRSVLKVFVPMCGKSRDLLWLSENGYESVGVECSKRAVEHFFSEQQLDFNESSSGKHVSYKTGSLEILLGDFFTLEAEDIGMITDIYDRASLIALPKGMRKEYVKKITQLQAPGTRTLLITLAYPQAEMEGPPFSVSDNEVSELYSDNFQIDKLASKNIIEDEPRFKDRGLTSLTETAFKLTRKR
ncbi:MAG: thiopurine S-methyltransferase [Gammaproteobacteria bacterium]|nr:thiopurine S-methyltransferase [Gammaproteobacteria bacterium]